MMPVMDTNGNATIDYTEFKDMMTTKIGERNIKEKLIKAFDNHIPLITTSSIVFQIFT